MSWVSQPLVLGLVGKAGSGKDTFYDIVSEAYPRLRIKRIAFADPVREMASKYLGWSDEGDKEENRWILQGVGSLFRKEISEDYWVRLAGHKIDPDYDVIIFTDCRFNNEVEMVREEGGTLVRIERYEYTGDHASETALDWLEVPYVISNTGTVKNYWSDVVAVFSTLWEAHREEYETDIDYGF